MAAGKTAKGCFNMKNTKSFLGLLALLLAISFMVLGCGDGAGGDPPPETATVSISKGSGEGVVLLTLSEGLWKDTYLDGPDIFAFTKTSGDVGQPTNTNTGTDSSNKKVHRVTLQVQSGKSWTGDVTLKTDAATLETLKGKTNVTGSLTIGTNTAVTVTASVKK
jgi:hypothetical protein